MVSYEKTQLQRVITKLSLFEFDQKKTLSLPRNHFDKIMKRVSGHRGKGRKAHFVIGQKRKWTSDLSLFLNIYV